MSTPEASLKLSEAPEQVLAARPVTNATRPLDSWMLAGAVIAAAAIIAAIASTGVNAAYFWQPAGALVVLGGTLGVTLITTPRSALRHCLQRIASMVRPAVTLGREELIEEIVACARMARTSGLLAAETRIRQTGDPFLRDMLLFGLDVEQRADFQAVFEGKVRLNERRGEADAKVLEVAGGFAPTLGVIGTVIGLIDVLRQFSNPSLVTYGIGTAFVSTIYGLVLANLVLLPAAQRIRVKVAEEFELQEMMVEGGLCVFDAVHPALVRQRLTNYLRAPETAAAPDHA